MNNTFSKILSIASYPFLSLIRLVQNNIDFLRTYKLKLIIARVLRIIRLLNGSASFVQFPDTLIPSSDPAVHKKIGFIDHSYHHKTISPTFFIDLLKQIGSVTVMWDSQWNGGKFPSFEKINAEGFDILILWQIMIYHHPEKLKKLNCKQIIIIPMFDDIHADPDNLFLRFMDFRFVCFCKSLHLRFNQLGLRSKYFQFFIDPSSLPYREDPFSELKGFFWQRTNDITWDHIRKLIEGSSFSSFHLHLALDPIWYREVMPTKEEIKKYHITITRWFDKKEEYLAVSSQANIFFTPRLYEGIGMPVIEAMTMGKVVVAPDHPTTNEYISHQKNGLLYDIHDLKPLDFSSAKTIAIQAREDSLLGFKNWQSESKELLDFIDLQD